MTSNFGSVGAIAAEARTEEDKMRGRATFSSLVGVLLALNGCTATVPGSPRDASGAGGSRGAAQLDAGRYPTQPRTPYGNANSPTTGAVMEAHRIANNVVLPNEVDPTLTKPSWFNTGTLATSDAIAVDIPAPGPDIAAAHHVLLGFSSCRTSESDILINVVLRFPDAAAAAGAASELAAKVTPPVPGRPVAIFNHPQAQAVGAEAEDFHAVESFLPHGPYVLYQYAQSDHGADAAAHLVAAALDLQVPRIDGFVSTDPARFPDLPIDPDEFLNRVVPTDDKTSAADAMTNLGDYQPQAALHFEPDPKAAALYSAGGVDAVAILRTTVYRARDAGAAEQMVDLAAADVAAGRGVKPVAAVPGLASAKCFDLGASERSQPRFECVGSADRYVFRAASQHVRDAQQQMASQYLLLTS
ncbi:MAG TPA: hypothetical protein VMU34_09220 [Mycobacterium sp.]|nr:hypothetical protein [Mycobacterium sp.]